MLFSVLGRTASADTVITCLRTGLIQMDDGVASPIWLAYSRPRVGSRCEFLYAFPRHRISLVLRVQRTTRCSYGHFHLSQRNPFCVSGTSGTVPTRSIK